MDLLATSVQRYAWGSHSAIPALLGEAQDGTPQAELWMGAHPVAASRVVRDGVEISLDHLVAADPTGLLGRPVVDAFGPRLPFLVKVLAAAEPLSLQAHPTLQQAVVGFERENRAGIALDAPARLYRDANHKPEILCALSEFHALCGFRPVERTVALLHALGTPTCVRLASVLGDEDGPSAGLRRAVNHLLRMDAADRPAVVGEVVAACGRPPAGWEDECRWALELAAAYPGDIGAVVALLLNLVRLQPGEAIFLGAGNLHAYLRGTGVEVMANSDNVLRGGLTPKHVDVDELLAVLDFSPLSEVRSQPVRSQPGTREFRTPAPDFRLWVHELSAGADLHVRPWGPEIVLSTSGTVHLIADDGSRLDVPRGRSAFIGVGEAYAAAGPATLHRVTVGDLA